MVTLLSPGDAFPSLALHRVGGGSLTIPDFLEGRYGIVLFYRGSWCPYCNAQLRAFQRAADGLAELGAATVALSVDDENTTVELIAKLGLTFPLGHSADASAISAATGAFVDPTGDSSSPRASFSTLRRAPSSASTPREPLADWFPRKTTRPVIDERYKMPQANTGNVTTFSEYNKDVAGAKIDDGGDILPDFPNVHLERNAAQRWLVINDRAENVLAHRRVVLAGERAEDQD